MAVAYPSTNEIVIEQRRRLRQLKLRQAREGRATPPEVTNEIVDLERQINDVAGVPASDAERWTLLYGMLQETRDELRADMRELHADVRRQWFAIPILMLALCGLLILLVRL